MRPSFEHLRRRVTADPLAGHSGDEERDAPPVCGRRAGVSRAVGQDHITFAPAGLAIGLRGIWGERTRRPPA